MDNDPNNHLGSIFSGGQTGILSMNTADDDITIRKKEYDVSIMGTPQPSAHTGFPNITSNQSNSNKN